MAEANAPREPLPEGLAYELHRLRNVVALAAFAAEARRVLAEVDAVVAVSPTAESVMSMIRHRRQWWELEDCTSLVLDDVCTRLDELTGRSGG